MIVRISIIELVNNVYFLKYPTAKNVYNSIVLNVINKYCRYFNKNFKINPFRACLILYRYNDYVSLICSDFKSCLVLSFHVNQGKSSDFG